LTTFLVSSFVGRGYRDAAEVSVFEPVAVAFEGDDLGVVDEPKARGFAESWSWWVGNPDAVAPLGPCGGGVRQADCRPAC